MNIYINNKLFDFDKNYNILQVCNIKDINIPKFCYHEKLSIAGNCRMCLVEVDGIQKPVASCALPISNNMKIFTDSKLVKKAREGILEFILLNHPLDCPICDQGGECDLQDQSLIYGGDKGRFYEYKRSVTDKNCGTLIKTIMTRCIHCTRCVRYIDEIAGFKYLGLIGRGNSMEISNFLDKIIMSEVSGNLIDLCPVGALTSKPYSFIARPWELLSFNTIDLIDIFHVNIRVDIRDSKILRILPRYNSNLNENWITDLTRFSYDSYKIRISNVLKKEYDHFLIKDWLFAINFINNNIKNKKINFVLGNFIDLETVFLLKKILNKFGDYSIKLSNVKNNFINIDFRKNYIFNQEIKKLNLYKNIILVGLNLRMENPLLNIKIKTLVDKNVCKVLVIGSNYNGNYFSINFNNSLKEIVKLIEGKSILNNIISTSVKSLLIFGQTFLNLFGNKIIFTKFFNYLKNKFDFSFMQINTTNIIAYDFNLLSSINNFNDFSINFNYTTNKKDVLYALNTDAFFLNSLNIAFSVYQGHHFLKEKINKLFDIILPTVTFLEKNSSYVNFFGQTQKTKFIVFPPKYGRSDFKILFLLFKFLNLNNGSVNSKFLKWKILSLKNFNFNFLKSKLSFILKFSNININLIITNVYKSNQITRFSSILMSCVKQIKEKYTNFI